MLFGNVTEIFRDDLASGLTHTRRHEFVLVAIVASVTVCQVCTAVGPQQVQSS
jgi:hypothetical protein